MKIRVYLAGPMTGLGIQDQIDWRAEVSSKFEDREILDPTRPTVLATDEVGCFNRDFWDIQNSTCILVNLLQPVEQISLGTVAEMAWSHFIKKPMIIVVDPATSHKLYVNHPFMKGFNALWVTNLEDAVDLIYEIHGR